MKTVFYVKGMACNRCAQMVKAELLGMQEVKEVNVTLEDGKVEIEQENGQVEQMKDAIRDLGYEVD